MKQLIGPNREERSRCYWYDIHVIDMVSAGAIKNQIFSWRVRAVSFYYAEYKGEVRSKKHQVVVLHASSQKKL